MEDSDTAAAYENVLDYHQRTKHHLHRYARSAGYMDWENQPNPFRFYEGTEAEPLPFLTEDPGADRSNLYIRYHSPPAPLNRAHIAGFLELSFALSAWKSAGGARWSLRINPSSGNLHPTEAHLILPPEGELPAGLYHYSPFLHAIEPRARIPAALWQAVRSHLDTDLFLVALTSIFWRESWKYGERAFRYCQHDAGHALAAASFAGALMGWRISVLSALSDDQIEKMLGFDRIRWHGEEAEHPDLMFAVHPEDHRIADRGLPEAAVSTFADLPLTGEPNRLSRRPVRWGAIADIAKKTRKPPVEEKIEFPEVPPLLEGPDPVLPPAAAIRRRRSATDYDPEFVLSREHFMAMMDRTLPRPDTPPFDAGPTVADVQLLVFVHRIGGLDPGLYLLLRDPGRQDAVRNALRSGFLWEKVEPDFPLFLLQRKDLRTAAMRLCCHQPIAGAGVFSLGMIARFEAPLRKRPWRYRSLFMETGMIGQLLYLEAEARGVRGTGIGCYFDDAVHETAGIAGAAYQSLYHFTVGLPAVDPRLRTDPPYAHLKTTRTLSGKEKRP